MKNLNFVDPERVVSKQEILDTLEAWFCSDATEEDIEFIEWINWLDSITNEVALTRDEAYVIFRLLGVNKTYTELTIYPPALLFNSRFFSDDSGLLKRFFRTDILDDERIKSIPLLFKKIGDKETFDPSVRDIINNIRTYCAQNETFAEAYQAKLAEIRNYNGSLPERIALYTEAYQAILAEIRNYNGSLSEMEALFHNVYLFFELEQPTFEMVKEYFNDTTILGTTFQKVREGLNWNMTMGSVPFFIPLLELSFISLLQTPDGIQIPRWNEENYLCRLILDYELKYDFGILDKLFRDYTTTDVVLIIRNHFKWCKNNMPQYPTSKSEDDVENHRKEYAKFLETQLPELFNGDTPHKYFDLLHNHLFLSSLDNPVQDLSIYLNKGIFHFREPFLYTYLIKKITSAISENNHAQIQDISRLLDNEHKDWIEKITHERGIQSYISSAMNFFESGDHAEKWQNILRASKNNSDILDSLLDSLVKNQKDKHSSLSLEDFVQQYIPLEIFPSILHSSFFKEQNEDVYQNMIKQYPSLSREDALLDRLLPCFADIAIKNTDKMLSMLDSTGTGYNPDDPYYSHGWKYEPTVQLFLCVFDQFCKHHEKEHESIELICEIIFRRWMYCVPAIHDIIKKYPQVQQNIIEYCYTMLKGSWDTPICTPISSYQIKTNIPACIIGVHKGPWHGVKPLLIALRKTRMEWVDASLNINSDCHPNDNNNLVEEIKLYFDFCNELSQKDLRQDMANGLSDWLKPLPESKRGDLKKRLTEFPEIEKDREGFDITYTEPDPIWRYAYVRAIADLGVDVDGKGHYIHSVIDKVAKEDPSEMVRTAAEKASAKFKKLRNGWDGDKHYQKIKLAFWWLKQASRLALNLPIDEDASLVTRSHDEQEKDYYEEERKRKEEREKQENERNLKKSLEAGETYQKENEKLMRARLKI